MCWGGCKTASPSAFVLALVLEPTGWCYVRGLAVPDEDRAPWTFQRLWWPAEEEQGINPIDYLFLFFKLTIQVLLA